MPFYQLSLVQLSLILFLLFYLLCLCIPELRPASRNMVWQCGWIRVPYSPSPPSIILQSSFSKMLSFCTCAHAHCCVHLFHLVEFYFRLRQLIAFPVLGQFCCVCETDESSTIFSGKNGKNIMEGGGGLYDQEPHCQTIFLLAGLSFNPSQRK